MAAITVSQLAEWIQGEVVGDGSLMITEIRPLSDASEGHLTFLEDEKYLAKLLASGASAAIVPVSVTTSAKTLIRVRDPLMSFVSLVQKLHPPRPAFQGIHSSAQIDPSAEIAAGVAIGANVVVGPESRIGKGSRLFPGVVIGNSCVLGEEVTIYPNVTLYDGCILGDRVIIHAGAVIGADGFGYRTQGGKHIKVPQLGHVEIEDDVEIGACTTIDRATFGATRIGTGTKIDNLVMIGHNCRIGRHNLFVSQVGIAGSVTTGDYVVMAGQVGIADHVHIGDRSILGAKAGVHKDVPPNQRMLGAPATPDKEQMRIMMTLEKLPEIRKDIRKIKQQLGITDTDGEKS